MTIRAAGGVVLRRSDDGVDVEVLLVHRPKYDDWSLPKGKCEDGEDDLACAVREVEEETGLRVEVGAELPSTEYHDRFDREKLVRYWVIRAAGGEFAPNPEVDEVCWVTREEAESLLSYSRDRAVVAAAAQQEHDAAHGEGADR